MLFAREHQSAIDDDALIPPAVDHEVHPELAETA
jgi:hypothetical protein